MEKKCHVECHDSLRKDSRFVRSNHTWAVHHLMRNADCSKRLNSVPNPFFVVSEVTRSRPRVQSMLNVLCYPPHPVFWASAIKRLRVLLYVIQILHLSDFVPAWQTWYHKRVRYYIHMLNHYAKTQHMTGYKNVKP